MSKWLKAGILFYLCIMFFGSFIAVGILITGALEDTYPFITDIKANLYYFFAGAIGGSLRHLYMFCSHYMKDELRDYREWIMYIFYPIFATGTAIMAVILIQSGILLIEFVDFGFNRFLNKLNAVSKNIFKTNPQQTNNPESNKKQTESW
ncbi:hypothetical protein J2Y03_002484 [Neobacillus niacini]|uniref:hypothetical protein n=1 Tax=Neobacillus niacini TaxID=86668 RepID=UPI00286288DD|nr:hypothetical protein [Neobacillus niacini]MDR7077460.1 hypothetical protein [Neobacillus niacini]